MSVWLVHGKMLPKTHQLKGLAVKITNCCLKTERKRSTASTTDWFIRINLKMYDNEVIYIFDGFSIWDVCERMCFFFSLATNSWNFFFLSNTHETKKKKTKINQVSWSVEILLFHVFFFVFGSDKPLWRLDFWLFLLLVLVAFTIP